MAIISSHVLDSVIGDHARHIQIRCFRVVADRREPLFDVIANEEGRIAETVDLDPAVVNHPLELVFHSAAYFASQPMMPEAGQIMPEIVVRFVVPDPAGRVHIPIMLSPHSYSIWWSS